MSDGYDPNHEAAACTNEIFYRNGPEPKTPEAGDATYIKATIAEYLLAAFNAGWKAADNIVQPEAVTK